MSKMIFVNLPVTDLPKSMAFYESLGFTNNPQFTDENAACMVWSDAIFVMLLTHGHWRKFTQRPFPAEGASEVMLAINFDSTDEVNRIVDLSGAQGGTADVNPKQDHGFMFSRSFADPDGHVWEVFWMDMAAMGDSAG
ncbi:lactoylglutathione lyase [Erythrobacter sp. SG61-1L]|uniref:VOC family protein n=1 Tax=Erythrobacter sp. SG61-1L TaxID=1603897 RepID=UPI0006C935BE|nr:VOC family protein [Erythrobacter sp. SG61-1L]KPL67036.1 lactoylglutathione lyase [Erythrobacter sp. SG61-1L]